MPTMMPPNGPTPPSYAKDQAAIWKEIRALWRQTQQGQDDRFPTETIFSFAGGPFAGSQSPPYQARLSAKIRQITVVLGTAGSTSSTVVAYLNGTAFSTIVIAAGDKTAFDLPDEVMNEGDVVTVAVTVLGTGALDFTIQMHWR